MLYEDGTPTHITIAAALQNGGSRDRIVLNRQRFSAKSSKCPRLCHVCRKTPNGECLSSPVSAVVPHVRPLVFLTSFQSRTEKKEKIHFWSYPDSNWGSWIQSPMCSPLHYRTCHDLRGGKPKQVASYFASFQFEAACTETSRSTSRGLGKGLRFVVRAACFLSTMTRSICSFACVSVSTGPSNRTSSCICKMSFHPTGESWNDGWKEATLP